MAAEKVDMVTDEGGLVGQVEAEFSAEELNDVVYGGYGGVLLRV